MAPFANICPLLSVLYEISPTPMAWMSAAAKSLHLLLVPWLGCGFTSSPSSSCFGIHSGHMSQLSVLCLLSIPAIFSVIPKDSASSLDVILFFHCNSLDICNPNIVLVEWLWKPPYTLCRHRRSTSHKH